METIDLEGMAPEAREKLFRLQQRVSVWKWAIGTIGLTVITTVASWHFQHREVRLQENRFGHERQMQQLEFEQKYLGEFLEYALVEDLDSRIRFAHYFSRVSTNEDLSTRWTAYHAELLASTATPDNGENPEDAEKRIGGKEALAGRKITRVFLGAEPVATMGDFHDYHVGQLGWADIGFHYYVTLDGATLIARPVGRNPAFVLNHNSNSVAVGIACSGWEGVTTPPPEPHRCEMSPEQQAAVEMLMTRLMSDYQLTPDVIGKRSDFRPVPDLLGSYVAELQLALARPDTAQTVGAKKISQVSGRLEAARETNLSREADVRGRDERDGSELSFQCDAAGAGCDRRGGARAEP